MLQFFINAPTATPGAVVPYRHIYKLVDPTPEAADWRRLDNVLNVATAGEPTTSDDSTLGYEIFSRRLDTATGTIYECTDPTATAAVWVQVYPSAGGGGAAIAARPPTYTDDSVAGHYVGQAWLDTSAGAVPDLWFCVVSTAGNAVWVKPSIAAVSPSPPTPPPPSGDFFGDPFAGLFGG